MDYFEFIRRKNLQFAYYEIVMPNEANLKLKLNKIL